jgi:hypothetical protein
VRSTERIIHDVTKVIGSMVIVQAKLGVLVQGVGNRKNGVHHESLGFKVQAKNPSGVRKSSSADYKGKWAHRDAQDGLAWKLEDSRVLWLALGSNKSQNGAKSKQMLNL